MTKYGIVVFQEGGEKGAMLQNVLISRLNAQGVISVPESEIARWYDMDRVMKEGCTHRYALHNREEADIFRTIMESNEMQDKSVKWRICRFAHSKEFRKWMKEVKKESLK